MQPINLTLQTQGIAPWLRERIDAVRSAADAKGVAIELRVDKVAVAFDPVHLGRAIDNLLDNAVRHARSMVVVSLAHPLPGFLAIIVDDDGDGVAAAIRDQVFEPFASGRPEGTGLGLALSREVALAHGGNLTFESSALGGARFVLELPWRAS